LAAAAAALAAALLLLFAIAALRLLRRAREPVRAAREERWRQGAVSAEEGLAMLSRGSLRARLLAIGALGQQREARAWDALLRLTRDRQSILSFAAARALLRIDPRLALEILGPAIVHRADWSLARIGTIFDELGPGAVTGPITTMLVSRSRDGLDRVVKLARFGDRGRVAPIMRGWLSSSDEPELIMAALAYVDNAADLPWALGAANHDEWRVRMAAARALGRIGAREEFKPLLDLLRDPVWWVRYHAAQALTGLRGLESYELETAHEDLRDAYASDMLAHALAEWGRRA
ncbi:MAG: HEAT repeat domain-containing protein, partial [Usitatibacter sp.]